MYGVRREAWKTEWIVHETGRSSLNATGDIAFSTLKGPYCFGFSLDPWCGSFRWVTSSQTWSLGLYWARGVMAAFLLMALVACSHASSILLTLLSTASLFVLWCSDGCNMGSIPKRIWLGDRLVVLFFLLLWTAVAIASQSDQSLGWPPVTSLKYCSTHWFFHSESPSIWGCEAVDRCCWIPRCLVSAFPKCEVNLGSLLLMIFLGSPYHG